MIASAFIYRKPVDPWREVFPHRLMFSRIPNGCLLGFSVDDVVAITRKRLSKGGPYILSPKTEFKQWAKKNLRGRYQFLFWHDIQEAKFLSANDSDYPDAYTVAFENERDAVVYKVMWG
jgi:hypothetical protein